MNGNSGMSAFDLPNDAETTDEVTLRRPNTVAVLGVLVAAAGMFSYLGAYCVTNVLVRNEVLREWAPGADPRPRWLLFGFTGLMVVFGCVAVLARCVSARQLKRIDEMEQGEVGPSAIE